jgi:glutamate/aspartate transport system substrate-binding protein
MSAHPSSRSPRAVCFRVCWVAVALVGHWGWLLAHAANPAGAEKAHVPSRSAGHSSALAPASTSALDGPVLRKLRTTGVITLGYRTASPPFSYLDAGLQPIGYSIELCERVVAHLRTVPGLADLDVRQVPVSSSTRLPLVANGTVDLECGATTNNAERQRLVMFSITTFVAEVRLLARRQAAIERLEDLQRRAVVTTIGTTSVQYLEGANRRRGLDIRIMLGLDDVEAFQLLESGRVDAFAMDDVLLKSVLLGAHNPAEYTISSQALSVEPYGLVMRRHDPAFKRLVDGALVAVFTSGEIHRLYTKWFQSPIPPHGKSLQLPMSGPLQRALREPTDSPDPVRYR